MNFFKVPEISSDLSHMRSLWPLLPPIYTHMYICVMLHRLLGEIGTPQYVPSKNKIHTDMFPLYVLRYAYALFQWPLSRVCLHAHVRELVYSELIAYTYMYSLLKQCVKTLRQMFFFSLCGQFPPASRFSHYVRPNPKL